MQKSNFKWQLINDSIIESDKKALTDFINTPNQRFTNGSKVKEFEEKWSEWLGVKHSVFVNSGSSANFISMLILKSLSTKKKRDYSSNTNLGIRYKFCNNEWF